ncbi:hypothetical protein T484DRAFT_3631172, partial [Baffinella frigidus]
MEPHAELLSALAVLARELGVSSLLSMDALREALHVQCSHCTMQQQQQQDGARSRRHSLMPLQDRGEIVGAPTIAQERVSTDLTEQSTHSSADIWNRFLKSNVGFQGEEQAASSWPSAFWQRVKTCLSELRRRSLVAVRHRDIWMPTCLVLALLLLVTLESVMVRATEETESKRRQSKVRLPPTTPRPGEPPHYTPRQKLDASAPRLLRSE